MKIDNSEAVKVIEINAGKKLREKIPKKRHEINTFNGDLKLVVK